MHSSKDDCKRDLKRAKIYLDETGRCTRVLYSIWQQIFILELIYDIKGKKFVYIAFCFF